MDRVVRLGVALALSALIVAPTGAWAQEAPVESAADAETTPPPTPAQEAAEVSALTVDAAFYTAFPLALDTGQTLGGALGALWRPASLGGFTFGGRVRLGRATEYDLFWEVEHDELLVEALAGWGGRVGESVELFATLGVGADLIFEERFRHQGERLDTLDDSDVVREGLSTAFYTELTGGARIFLVDGWGMQLAGGPALGVLEIDGAVEARLGWSAMLGIIWQYREGL